MYLYFLIIIASILSASSYLIRAITNTVPRAFMIGMILLTLGYTLLSIAKTYQVELEYDATREDFKEKRQRFISFLAYFMILLFFIFSYGIKDMTPHRRWYDFFAFLGFGCMTLVHVFRIYQFIPISMIFLIIYYLFAAMNKHNLDFIHIIQTISRVLFAVFYTVALYHNHFFLAT